MTAVQSEAFVRNYDPATDRECTVQVFRETCAESLKIEPIWTIGSFIWCRPYLFLEPDNCFVLDDGNGKAVGYVIGAPDSQRFCQRWITEFIPGVKAELNNLPPINTADETTANSLVRRRQIMLDLVFHDPRKLIYGNLEQELHQYRGHLHIDILPAYQRRGYGRQLIRNFVQSMKLKGCPGVFLGMVASNVDGARFYEAVGFKRLPKVLDEGISGEMGRTSKSADGGEEIYFVVEL